LLDDSCVIWRVLLILRVPASKEPSDVIKHAHDSGEVDEDYFETEMHGQHTWARFTFEVAGDLNIVNGPLIQIRHSTHQTLSDLFNRCLIDRHSMNDDLRVNVLNSVAIDCGPQHAVTIDDAIPCFLEACHERFFAVRQACISAEGDLVFRIEPCGVSAERVVALSAYPIHRLGWSQWPTQNLFSHRNVGFFRPGRLRSNRDLRCI